MAGGFSVLKDVSKTLVYRLARFVNQKAQRELIPQRVFSRPPSAELAHDQTDQDHLPPYEVLDAILREYVEEDKSLEEICNQGFDRSMVENILERIEFNEYKRRQAPPGLRITKRAFGRDRRYPITSSFYRSKKER